MVNFNRLKQNSEKDLKLVVETLIKIIDRIIDSDLRRVYLDSQEVAEYLMPYNGGLETLFEIGFIEDDDSFILPSNVKNEFLISIKKELDSLISLEKCSGPVCSTSKPRKINVPKATVNNHKFALKLQNSLDHVLIYEDPELKQKALNQIPVEKLKQQAKNKFKTYIEQTKDKQAYDLNDFLLLELLSWFKNDFFKWINQPDCVNCLNNEKMVFKKNDFPSGNEVLWMAGNVEVYECSNCKQTTRFPRYNHPEILLETRGGRCGEWANCFCLCLRAMDYDARYVLDWTDHVWCEVYSKSQKRWLHADPCENVLDKPLIYEHGWNKKLSYIIAFSKYECLDVTWRYSVNHDQVLERRNECDENWLAKYTFELSNKRQSGLTKTQINDLRLRLVYEIVEFMSPKTIKEGEDIGRQSGSLQWRLDRGEIQVNSEIQNLNKIRIEPENGVYNLKYNTVRDLYIIQNNKETKNWNSLCYSYSNIKLKIEHDWKMCYLARENGNMKAYIEWVFDLEGLDLKKIELLFESKCFETGEIDLRLIGITKEDLEHDILLKNNNDENEFFTSLFEKDSNIKSIKLRVDLSKGVGNNAWQHTQLFRQSLNDFDKFLFNIKFYF